MRRNLVIRNDIKRIAERLIDKEFRSLKGINIAYLGSDMLKIDNAGMPVYAKVKRVGYEYQWLVKYDVFLIVYEPCIDGFDKNKIIDIVKGQLSKIHVETDKKTGDIRLFIYGDMQ